MKDKFLLEMKDNWPNYLWNFIIFGLFLTLITYLIIIPSINPNPEVEPFCHKTEGGIVLNLYNKGRVPAEDFNILIYEEYQGGTSFFPNYELCKVVNFDDSHSTLIHCDYIPPKSNATRQLFFKNKSKSEFKYLLWGQTTPLKSTKIFCS